MLLQIENLHTVLRSRQGSTHAVRGIDLHIEQGETLCLVGESGSGKSVTALSVMRLLPEAVASHPQGKVIYENQTDLLKLDNDLLPRFRGREIAMIFQEPMLSLNPVFTIGEQIVEAIQLTRQDMPYSKARRTALNAMADVRLDNPETRFNDYPHRLSGGQRQRVMIAMALACRSRLLIADEPTTALDVTVQAEILALIRDLQLSYGMGVLFITHDLGVVAQIADRVAVMKDGRIVEQGDRDDVLYSPQHEYTRRLIGALPQNLHRPRVVSEADAPASEVLLETRNLKVEFPLRGGLLRRVVSKVRAVDGVSLKIRRAEILALVGESGSGKSTLGRAIVRLLKPDGGQIFFDGKDIAQMSSGAFRSLRTDIQIVFQDPSSSLNPRLDIATILTEPMAVHGIGRTDSHREQLARELLAAVNLPEESLWRYPHEFSGGQRQRIGIARALAVDPQIIVCDEITSALDVSIQSEILELLLDLRKRYQLTLLFITHDISVVEFISDHTAVMYKGQLVETGPTDLVCKQPQHEYTQALLNAVPRFRSNSQLAGIE